MTHGERWLTKAHARLAGWCRTRGWKCSEAFKIGRDQYEVLIKDRTGLSVPIAFDMGGDAAYLVDDYGMAQDFDAVTFDRMMEAHGLAMKIKPSKRQLELFECPTA